MAHAKSSQINKKELNIRQSDEWGQYLEFLKWKPMRISNGTLVAVIRIPVLGSLVKIQRPPNLKKKDLEEIEKICQESKALFVKIEPSYGQNTRVLEQEGYNKSLIPLCPPTTIYMDLTKSEEELWKSLSRSGKYSIKRAQREGSRVEFYPNPSPEKIEESYQVLKYTGKTKKFYVQPIRDTYKKVEIFGDRSYLVNVYDGEGELAGAKFYLGYEDQVLYVHGGTTVAGKKGKAGYDLMWQSILYFQKLGYKVLDLEGKDDERFPGFTKGWEGFSHFKEKFHGEVIEFPYPYIKIFNPIFYFLTNKMGVPM